MRPDLSRTTVRSGRTGEVVEALVLRCCEQENFKVFQIEGQTHAHLQCCVCESSYCPTGACVSPNDYEIYPQQ